MVRHYHKLSDAYLFTISIGVVVPWVIGIERRAIDRAPILTSTMFLVMAMSTQSLKIEDVVCQLWCMGGGYDVVHMGMVVGTMHIGITACTLVVSIHQYLLTQYIPPTLSFIQVLGVFHVKRPSVVVVHLVPVQFNSSYCY